MKVLAPASSLTSKMTEYNLSPTKTNGPELFRGIGPPVHVIRSFPEGPHFFEANPSLRIRPEPCTLFGVELES